MKLGFFASTTTLLGALAFATLTSTSASADAAGTACVHRRFNTELVKQACEKGGQTEAKNVMKAFEEDAHPCAVSVAGIRDRQIRFAIAIEVPRCNRNEVPTGSKGDLVVEGAFTPTRK